MKLIRTNSVRSEINPVNFIYTFEEIGEGGCATSVFYTIEAAYGTFAALQQIELTGPLPIAKDQPQGSNVLPLEFKVYQALKICPFCKKDLEIHPFSGNKACFVHGDFIVKLINGEVNVEFELINFK